jgi:hypothetical protein
MWSLRKIALLIVVVVFSSMFSVARSPAVSAAASPKIKWVTQFGTDGGDDASGVSSIKGQVYVVGVTSGAFPDQNNFGGNDAFVAKFNKSGKLQWSRQFGSPFDDSSTGVALDSSGVYIAGYTYGGLFGRASNGSVDAFVVKYDKNGNLLWANQFGTDVFDWASGVEAVSSGIYVVGGTTGAFPGQANAGGQDVFVARLDSSGNVLWLKQFGTRSLDEGFGIFVDASGIYVAGDTYGTFPGQTSAGGLDAFIAKFDISGTPLWFKQFGGSSDDQAYAVSGYSSDLYIAGLTFGTLPGQVSSGYVDAFVVKCDDSGNVIWMRQFGTETYDGASGIAAVASGIYLSGVTWGTLPGQSSTDNDDSFVAKFDSSGNMIWVTQFGTDGSDYVSGIVVDRKKFYVSGQTAGVFDVQESAGGDDAFLAKFKVKSDKDRSKKDSSGGRDNSEPKLDNGKVPQTQRQPRARGHTFEIGDG